MMIDNPPPNAGRPLRIKTRLGIILAITGATLFSAGCATLGPAYTPDSGAPKDKATVYVYRSSAMAGGAISYKVAVNGVDVSSLPSGGYFVSYVKAGENEISAKTEAKTSVTIDAKAGQSYYVKGTLGMGVLVGHPHLVEVSSDVGSKEIAKCKLVPPASTAAAR
jgi:hypothetical protein